MAEQPKYVINQDYYKDAPPSQTESSQNLSEVKKAPLGIRKSLTFLARKMSLIPPSREEAKKNVRRGCLYRKLIF